MADLYALFGVLDRLDGLHSATERGFIRELIRDRFWKGGGSYMGFYDALMSRNRKLNLSRLDVASLQYAFPGEIVMRGNAKVLSSIQDVMDVFEENRSAAVLNRRRILKRVAKALDRGNRKVARK